MELKLDFDVLENLEDELNIEEVEALDLEGSTGAAEGASSVGSGMPIFPYFWFTCSA
ncbi:hypothetical protein [Virgibacillus sediminis]|uniref:Thiocillin family RiPP n=1 Tax=Virgibacillus sediminis TaxID=202260 RepID=A0ABV7AA75_9BACI